MFSVPFDVISPEVIQEEIGSYLPLEDIYASRDVIPNWEQVYVGQWRKFLPNVRQGSLSSTGQSVSGRRTNVVRTLAPTISPLRPTINPTNTRLQRNAEINKGMEILAKNDDVEAFKRILPLLGVSTAIVKDWIQIMIDNNAIKMLEFMIRNRFVVEVLRKYTEDAPEVWGILEPIVVDEILKSPKRTEIFLDSILPELEHMGQKDIASLNLPIFKQLLQAGDINEESLNNAEIGDIDNREFWQLYNQYLDLSKLDEDILEELDLDTNIYIAWLMRDRLDTERVINLYEEWLDDLRYSGISRIKDVIQNADCRRTLQQILDILPQQIHPVNFDL